MTALTVYADKHDLVTVVFHYVCRLVLLDCPQRLAQLDDS